jgi:hypothetical protein
MTVLIVCVLSLIIHFVGTIAYCVRLVSIRTKRGAIAWTLFGVLMLFSRLATTFQAPLLAKYLEEQILKNNIGDNDIFRYIIGFSFLGTILGVLCIPTVNRLFERAIEVMYQVESVPKFILRLLRWKNISLIQSHLALPTFQHWIFIKNYKDIPLKIMLLHVLNHAFLTTSVLSCLLAGYLQPDIRATAASMNGVINGMATFFFMVFVDPDMAILTDKVMSGEQTEVYFKKYFSYVVMSRVFGTLLAQILLVPLAYLIVWIVGN